MVHVIRVLLPIMVALLSLTQHGCKSEDEKKLEKIKEHLEDPNIHLDDLQRICQNEVSEKTFKPGKYRQGKLENLFKEVAALCGKHSLDEKKLEKIKERLEDPNINQDEKQRICLSEVSYKVLQAEGSRKWKVKDLHEKVLKLCQKNYLFISMNYTHFHEGEQEAAVQAKPHAHEDDVEKRGPAKISTLFRAQNKEENRPAKLINHFPEQDDQKHHIPSQLVLDRDT